MHYDYRYLSEKFSKAVETLATGTGSIQTRLADATRVNLLPFRPEELPDDIRDRVLIIKARLTSATPKSNEDRLQATVNRMTGYEASEIASEILSIYENVIRRDIE